MGKQAADLLLLAAIATNDERAGDESDPDETAKDGSTGRSEPTRLCMPTNLPYERVAGLRP